VVLPSFPPSSVDSVTEKKKKKNTPKTKKKQKKKKKQQKKHTTVGAQSPSKAQTFQLAGPGSYSAVMND
jgi:hypothetical protein